MGSNISISNGIGSNIWESSQIFVTVRMMVVLSERSGLNLDTLGGKHEGARAEAAKVKKNPQSALL
jgi:hypothetical protein